MVSKLLTWLYTIRYNSYSKYPLVFFGRVISCDKIKRLDIDKLILLKHGNWTYVNCHYGNLLIFLRPGTTFSTTFCF